MSYCLWLLASFILCSAAGAVIEPYLPNSMMRDVGPREIRDVAPIVSARAWAAGFALWVVAGWWWGGQRVGRRYLLSDGDRRRVLNRLVLVGAILWGIIPLAAILLVPFSDLPRFSGQWWLLGLLLWPSMCFGLGWVFLPDGWRRESLDLIRVGDFPGAATLVSEVEAETSALSEEEQQHLDDLKSRITEAKSKGSGIVS